METFIEYLIGAGFNVTFWSSPYPTQVEITMPDGSHLYYRYRGGNASLVHSEDSTFEQKRASAGLTREAWLIDPRCAATCECPVAELSPEENIEVFQTLLASLTAKHLAA